MADKNDKGYNLMYIYFEVNSIELSGSFFLNRLK